MPWRLGALVFISKVWLKWEGLKDAKEPGHPTNIILLDTTQKRLFFFFIFNFIGFIATEFWKILFFGGQKKKKIMQRWQRPI